MKLITTIHNLEQIESLSKLTDGFLLGNESYAVRLTKSFSVREMIDAIYLIHALDKKVFILMNQMMTDDELNSAKNFVMMLPDDKVDGFVISDIGLIPMFKELDLVDKVIYNPETLLTNHFDFNYLSIDGIKGAFVSKEITLEDIKEIGKAKKYQLFMYGHGHMSMFYSKRQILTAYTDYLNKDSIYHNDHELTLQEPKRDKEDYPILEDQGGTHVFRGHVFQSLNNLNELRDFVDYLLIDTIFQTDDYAKEILSLYRENSQDESKRLNIQNKYGEQWTDGFLHKKTIYKGKNND